ncbi:hypothetical protein Q1695_013288 [Nippostrongylus brasiliensis]|nr:hypothetical protein Q1695_013288 [Nippostrongylus brasiliensis]
MRKSLWDTLMDQPQEVDDDTPLLMDINEIENVITDQLQALERMKSTLRELRAKMQRPTSKPRRNHHRKQRDVYGRT